MRNKRMMLIIFDVSFLAIASLLINATFPAPAFAYVDPSVMTYTIQALAGVAVALSAVLGVVFRRTRRMLLKALHIDENAGKFVEPPISRIKPEEELATDARYISLAAAGGRSRTVGGTGAPVKEGLRWRTRFLLSLLAVGTLVLTVMIVSPFELVAGNEDSLVYGLADVCSLFVFPALGAWIGGSLLLSAFRRGAFDTALLLVIGVAVATYCQVLFLNNGLPTADGTAVDWTSYSKRAVISTLLWLIIACVPLLARCLSRVRACQVACIVCGVLAIVQAVGAASVVISSFQARAKAGNSLTENGMLTVSPKKNAIVFVLDQYDTVIDLMPALQSDPELLDEMTGFTWYQNSAAVITPTREAIPYMLNSITPSTHHEQGSDSDPHDNQTMYLSEFKDAGYSVGVYDDLVDPCSNYLKGIAMNDASREDMNVLDSVDKSGLYKTLLSCGLLRDLPWAFKPFFWFYTDDINQAMTSKADDATYDPASTTYATDDAAFARKLHEYGLSASDEGESGAFRFIHLNGAHNPYVINEEERPDENASRQQQAIGAMNIVRDYIVQLKELGLYDDATIIITADHGRYSYYNTGDSDRPFLSLNETSVPIMLVKPSQSSADAMARLTVSNAPVSTDDVMPTVAGSMDGAKITAGDVDMLGVIDEDRVRYFYQLSKDDNGEHGIVEYEIAGNADDFCDWKRTGWVQHYPELTWDYIGDGTE